MRFLRLFRLIHLTEFEPRHLDLSHSRQPVIRIPSLKTFNAETRTLKTLPQPIAKRRKNNRPTESSKGAWFNTARLSYQYFEIRMGFLDGRIGRLDELSEQVSVLYMKR